METDPKGYPPALWRKAAELGWQGMALPEKYGGQDLPLVYLGLIFEEAGRAVAPLPLHSTVVAALTIARDGNEREALSRREDPEKRDGLKTREGRMKKSAEGVEEEREGKDVEETWRRKLAEGQKSEVVFEMWSRAKILSSKGGAKRMLDRHGLLCAQMLGATRKDELAIDYSTASPSDSPSARFNPSSTSVRT
jgi:hypothetical protein